MIVNSNKLRHDINNIPEAMQNTNAWCGFYNNAEGHLDKKPISILTKRGGLKSASSEKLVPFEKALSTLNEGKIAAIGIGLTKELGMICIDLDCHNLTLKDKYEELKALLLSKFRSYAEVSISGMGTHIFIKGKLPEGLKNKDSFGIIEIFDERFVVTTGDIIDGRSSEIFEEQEALEWLCDAFLQKNDLRYVSIIPPGKSTKSDQEIIDKINSFSKGKLFLSGKFEQIKRYNQSSKEYIQAYPSKSEADLAFCNLLLFLNGNDPEQATRIFLNSGMAKDLEKKSSGYIQSQINYASTTLQSVYDWSKNKDIEVVDEPEELDPEEKQKAFLEKVAKEGFTISDNQKLNDYCTKYLLNFGYNPDRLVIDTSLGDFDSAGNGKRFFYIMNTDLIYNPTSDEWARWDGKKWCRCYDLNLLGASQKVFDNLKHEAFQLVMKSVYELDAEKKIKLEQQALELFQYASTNKSKRNCMEMIEFSKSHFNPNEHLKLETSLNALNIANGIFDFDKMRLISHCREYYQTMVSDVLCDTTADCPIWKRTLERIIPDSDIRHYVQKCVGYTISARYGEKALFILYGSGNNGKTTFINVLKSLLGDYSVVVNPQTIMENNSNSNNGPRPDLIKLRDKRFACVSESNENDRLSEGIIKSLTGAGYISCRTLHKEPIEFKAMGKYWFDTNHKPTVKGTDTAIWSRLKVIPFEVQIPKSEIDTTLGAKLESELSGILNWAIEGYRLYIEEGLIEPEHIRMVVEEYAESMSAMDQWLKECVEVKTDLNEIQKTSVNSKELYQSYRNWCVHNGEFNWSQRKFTAELNKKEFAKLTKFVNGIVRYKLIKLNPLGELCYKKDTLYANEFQTQYNECINGMFIRQAKEENALKKFEDKTVKTSANVILMPGNADLLGFGQ